MGELASAPLAASHIFHPLPVNFVHIFPQEAFKCTKRRVSNHRVVLSVTERLLKPDVDSCIVTLQGQAGANASAGRGALQAHLNTPALLFLTIAPTAKPT